MAIYRVTVGGNEYQVEIEDVNTQPVRALVNGQLVQVWVQDRQVRPASFEGRPAPQATPATPSLVVPSPPPDQSEAGESGVRAPMPGSIVSVAVQPGDRVKTGQDVCVLEAMKMKNHIRAPRSGTIAQVSVSPGQQVQHGDLLVTFTD